MGVFVNENKKQFHLQNSSASYVIGVNEFGYLECLYYGPKLAEDAWETANERMTRGHSVSVSGVCDRSADASQMFMEWGCYGQGDYREPAILALLENGSRITDLRYEGYRFAVQPENSALPHGRNGTGLEITLCDAIAGIRVCLHYTTYDEIGVIARSVVIENLSDAAVVLQRAYSFNVDLPNDDFDMVSLCGAQLRERCVTRSRLVPGIHRVDSKRGVSSAQRNPFVALCQHHADENSGDVFGFTLLYSGSFALNVELDECNSVRVNGGITDFDFRWYLEPNERLETPECVMAFSQSGFNGMSQAYHDFFRKHVMPEELAYTSRPIVINSWEAMYFDFDEEKLRRFVDEVADIGIDLFVLDDGWFGHRDNDRSSLGDWTADIRKLPNGLKSIRDYCHSKGLRFGLWFEPEMISKDSALYEQHPDWCIHVPSREPCVGRDQLVLDMTRQEVQDYLKRTLCGCIDEFGLTYIKWDMNRCITENYPGELPRQRAQEFSHRYVLGLYGILRFIQERYPKLLIESCASGGCRFDGGMLRYSAQIWTSDNTDAWSRAKIQYGTSYVYPPSAMSCHLSACPNAQTGRTTRLEDRYRIASLGAFGYELNPKTLSPTDKETLRQYNAVYRNDEALVLRGKLYRLKNPFEGELFAQLLVSEDQSRAKLVIMSGRCDPNGCMSKVRLQGLIPEALYRIEENGRILSGSSLLGRGLDVAPLSGDYMSAVYHIERIS